MEDDEKKQSLGLSEHKKSFLINNGYSEIMMPGNSDVIEQT